MAGWDVIEDVKEIVALVQERFKNRNAREPLPAALTRFTNVLEGYPHPEELPAVLAAIRIFKEKSQAEWSRGVHETLRPKRTIDAESAALWKYAGQIARKLA